MQIVIDTNILVNALRSRNQSSKAIRLLDDVFDGVHQMCVSSEIMDEYRDVLFRPQLHIDEILANNLLKWIESNAVHIEPSPSDAGVVVMKDEDDRIFFDVARCLNAKLITRNHKHYPVHELITLIDELYD